LEHSTVLISVKVIIKAFNDSEGEALHMRLKARVMPSRRVGQIHPREGGELSRWRCGS